MMNKLPMKFIAYTFLFFVILLMSNFNACSQDSTAKMKTWVKDDKEFPGGQAALEKYLINNIDTTVPIRNKAKKGTYNVVVRFIISKDGIVSDVTPETRYGYGMEEELVKAIKKYSTWNPPRWKPAPQNAKTEIMFVRQSFVFFVPGRKGFFGRLFGKH